MEYKKAISRMIASIASDESHLFDDSEWILLQTHCFLSGLVEDRGLIEDGAQSAIYALITTTRAYVRVDKAKWYYAGMIEEIDASGVAFVTIHSVDDVDTLLACLIKDELVALASSLGLEMKSSIKVGEMRDAIKESNSKDMIRLAQSAVGTLISIDHSALLVYERLFIAFNRYRSMPNNLLLDSILTNTLDPQRVYPTYTVNTCTLTWPSRDIFVSYCELLRSEKAIHALVEANDNDSAIDLSRKHREDLVDASFESHMSGIAYLNVYAPQHVLCRIAHCSVKYILHQALAAKRVEGGGSLKKVKFTIKTTKMSHRLFTEAKDVLELLLNQHTFLQKKRGGWYEKLAMIHENYLDNIRTAVQVCTQALDSDIAPHWKRAILKRMDRIRGVKQGEVCWREECIEAMKVDRGGAQGKALYRDEAMGEPVHVETLAVRHYESKGWQARHAENGTLSGIFALLFWDILFYELPGVFASPYQSAPLDFGSEFFYSDRRDIIDARYAAILRGEHLDIIKENDLRERQKKTFCAGLSWSLFTLQELLEVVECIGVESLVEVCKIFVGEGVTGGFPDLCVWNSDEKLVSMVEVKGQGDHLSETQKNWLEALNSCNIDAFVLHVKAT